MVSLKSLYDYVSRDWDDTIIFILVTILLLFIPIIGWFALGGIYIKLLSDAFKKKKKLPKVFENFWKKFFDGFKLFLILLITIIVLLIVSVTVLTAGYNIITYLIVLIIGAFLGLLLASLSCNYSLKKKFSAFFEIETAIKIMLKDKENTIRLVLLLFLYGLVKEIIKELSKYNLVLNIIISLIIIPISLIVSAKLTGDWYRENSK